MCMCSHRDVTIPHRGLSLSIHSLEVIVFNFCPYWPAGRWLAWIPFLSEHQIWPDRNLLGLITKLAAALQTCSFCLWGLQIGCTECELLQNMGLFVIFTLLCFYDHPVNVSTVKSWLNQTVPKKAILVTKLFFTYMKSKKVNEALKSKYTCVCKYEKAI